jgi:excisionase family DNA binding protein
MSQFGEIYMTPDQVAERLQVDPETVRRWLRAKKLRASRISAKAWRISERSLSQFMEERAAEQQQGERPKKAHQAPRKPNLADFLRDSPLAGSELMFERVKDSPRPIDL